MNLIDKILEHKLVVAMTIIGGLVYALYEPITKVFFEGYFHPNIIIDLQVESFNIAANRNLLVLHVLPTNKGNVPYVIKDKNVFTLEVRRLKDLENNKWVDYDKQELITKVDLLRNIVTDKGDTYTIETNGIYDEIESIPLANGVYYVNAILNYDGAYINQSAVVKLPINKN
jgi:hypothetical protein